LERIPSGLEIAQYTATQISARPGRFLRNNPSIIGVERIPSGLEITPATQITARPGRFLRNTPSIIAMERIPSKDYPIRGNPD